MFWEAKVSNGYIDNERATEAKESYIAGRYWIVRIVSINFTYDF